MSATHNTFGASGPNRRPTRSFARAAAGSAIVVRLTLPRRTPCSPRAFINPLDGAAGHRDPFPVQLEPHLAGAVDTEILCVDPGDVLAQFRVAAPRRRRCR